MTSLTQALLVLAVTVAIDGVGVRRNQLVYEDARQVHHAPSAATLWPPHAGRWLIAWTWSTGSPRRVHAGNLALHVVDGALVGRLAWQLGLGEAWWIAAAIVWAHPLASEAVLYGAGGRGELLAALGILIACVSIGGKRLDDENGGPRGGVACDAGHEAMPDKRVTFLTWMASLVE